MQVATKALWMTVASMQTSQNFESFAPGGNDIGYQIAFYFFIYMAQNHKSQFALQPVQQIQHPQTLDRQFGYGKTFPQKILLTVEQLRLLSDMQNLRPGRRTGHTNTEEEALHSHRQTHRGRERHYNMKTIGREEERLILLRNNDPNVWMRQPGERERGTDVIGMQRLLLFVC